MPDLTIAMWEKWHRSIEARCVWTIHDRLYHIWHAGCCRKTDVDSRVNEWSRCPYCGKLIERKEASNE